MITIQKYHKKDIKQWDSFVQKSLNGTVFQTQHFLAYHVNRIFHDCSISIKYKKNIVAVLPGAIIIDKKKNKIFYSHPGASYGGLVISKKIHFDLLHKIILEIDQYCIKNGFNQIILINSPSIYYCYQDDSLDYLLNWNSYIEKETYISHAVNLSDRPNIKSLLSKRKKRYLKNSQTLDDIVFKQTTHLEKLYELLLKSKLKYGLKPTHSLEELKQLIKTHPSDIKVIVSQHNKETVGGMILFLANKSVCLVFYNIISEKFRNSQLASLQLYHCLKFAQKYSYQYIDFGVSHTPEKENPLSPKFSLIQFKEHFAAKGVLRKVYQKKYVLKK
tara:strand:+ start:612 stop:1604 length:993 start_codon:yes stop_codon:yes gene_type:complete